MTRRVAALAAALIVASLAVPAVVAADGGQAGASAAVPAGPVAQQQANNTTADAAEWSPPGPFGLEELQTGGTKDADAPTSTRALGQPVRGGMLVQYTPLQLIGGSRTELAPGEQIETDTLRLFGSTYGDAVGEYELVIVYWQPATKTVNGTQVEYAANQSVQRVGFETENGYWAEQIRLNSHYDGAIQATMWVERNGERIDGARWRFEHRSNPLTAAPGIEVNSEGDLWRWAAVVVLLPALPGIFIGRRGARHVLDQTVVGPQWSSARWLVVIGLIGLVAGTVATWQTSAVLARAPWVVGLLFTVVSFVAFLGWNDRKTETAQFSRKEIGSTPSLNGGDEVPDVRSETILQRTIVREDGKIYMPAKGIRPFIARYWARPAQVEEQHLATTTDVDGDVSKRYEIDPESEAVLEHQPAHLEFAPEFIHESDAPTPGGDTWVGSLESVVSRLNWRTIGIGGIGGYLVFAAVDALTGAGAVAGLVATVPFLVVAHDAHDGALRFDPAPYHFSSASAILATERQTYREARTFEDLHKMVANLDLEVIDRTQETTEAVRSELRDKINAMFRVPNSPDVDSVADDGDDDGPPQFGAVDPTRDSGVSDD